MFSDFSGCVCTKEQARPSPNASAQRNILGESDSLKGKTLCVEEHTRALDLSLRVFRLKLPNFDKLLVSDEGFTEIKFSNGASPGRCKIACIFGGRV